MLYQTKETPAETFGTVQKTTVTMAMNRKSFDVVIDQLYSDTMRAAIREVMANAWDSHVAAGKPETPFTLVLPSTFDPTFTVRDYGTSMSEKIIEEVYSVMFASTKDKSNDETGTFGLGSKSPFAYTDVYTLTCFLDGECRVYSCYLGEDGIPNVDLVSRGATAEENGCAVSFPVKPEDVYDFRHRVFECGRGYDVLPETNDEDFWKELTENPVMSGKGWKILPRTSGLSYRPHVRQGCVVYPLDAVLLSTEFGYDSIQRQMLNMNIVIDMPLGSVSITPSREALKYTDDTIKNLSERMQEIADEIKDTAEARFNACKTYAEVIGFYQQMRDDNAFGEKLFRKAKWRGRKLRMFVATDERGRKPLFDIRVMHVTRSDFVHGRTYRSNGFSGRFESAHTSFAPDNFVLFVEDTTGDRVTHSGLRVKEKFMSITQLDHSIKGFLWVKGDPNCRDFKRLLVNLGRPDVTVINVNDLPKPTLATRTSSGTRSAVKCKVFNRATNRWDTTDIDDDADNVFYVRKVRNDYPDFGCGLHNFNKWLKVLEEQGFFPHGAMVVEIPATHKRLIEKNKDVWKNLRDVIDTCLDTVDVGGLSINHYIHGLMDERTLDRKTCQLARQLAAHGALPKERTPFRELVVRFRVLSKNSERLSGQKGLVEMFKNFRADEYATSVNSAPILGMDVLHTAKIMQLTEDFNVRYPLVRNVMPLFGSVDIALMDHLLSYINLVDADRKS